MLVSKGGGSQPDPDRDHSRSGKCIVENPESVQARLTREEMVDALRALDAECSRREITGELCIYGGAQMVLVFDARSSTRDIDAVFRPKSEIRDAAERVAQDLSLPTGWLNDGVKGFLSGREDLTQERVPDLDGLTSLRIIWPTPEYLIAMKCLAARVDDTATDRDDVQFLIRKLGLTDEREILDIVERFYPASRIHIKTRYFIQEILAGLKRREEGGP